MSNNHLNDISRVYLSQVAEESPGEKIDRKSQEGVAKQKIKADAEKEARAKSAAAFQKHKNSVLAKGGRHVDALDSWHSKEAYERNASLREEVKCSKKGKKSTKSSVAQDPVENDQVSDQFAGMISSEGWKPDPVEKRKKKAADLYRREKIAQDTPAKYKTDKTEDPDKLYKRRMAVDSKVKMKAESLSNWRNDLIEIVSEPEEKAEKEVTEKKVKNKVIINPSFQESIKEIGGEVLEAVEVDEYIETVQKVKKAEAEADIKRWQVDEGNCDDCGCKGCGKNPCVECGEDHHKLGKVNEAVKGEDTQDRKDAASERRKGIGKLKSKKEGESYAKWTMAKHPKHVDEQLDDTKKDDPLKKKENHIKKQVLIKKLQALRTGGDGITASYEPEGEVIDETLMSVQKATYGMPNEKRKAIIDKYKKSEKNRGTDKKKGRDAGALARERLQKEDKALANVIGNLKKDGAVMASDLPKATDAQKAEWKAEKVRRAAQRKPSGNPYKARQGESD